MENLQQKPRCVLLYRASSKKQTDSENDIPQQRDILKPWAERQGWEFVCEKVEGGVSGYKVSAEKRDAIQEIKLMAERKEFEVLGIYMSDRLGRISEETPLIISFLNARGIRVISYAEGEINSSTHSDKLLTYIRYWQAEGESLKTSMRVADAGEANVRAGKWRGGNAPYGYRSVSRGTLNYKGKPIFDVEIDPETSETVKTVFRLYGKEHYGSKGIAKYLNDKGISTRDGGLWNGSLILKMLKNTMYTGVYELHRIIKSKPQIFSPVMPHLVIVSQEDFGEVQALLKKNKIAPNARRPTQYGALMLTGLLYCGECGRKFTSNRMSAKRQRVDGSYWEYECYRYRCSSYHTPVERKETCHQTIYRADILEKLVVQHTKAFIRETDKSEFLKEHIDGAQSRLADATKRFERAEADLDKKDREIEKLKEEVIKALLGESNYSHDMLSGMLKAKEAERIALTEKFDAAQDEVLCIDQELSAQVKIAEDFDDWDAKYDAAPAAVKKKMLINIIDRIEGIGPKIGVYFKMKLDFDPTAGLTLPGTKPLRQHSVHFSINSSVNRVSQEIGTIRQPIRRS